MDNRTRKGRKNRNLRMRRPYQNVSANEPSFCMPEERDTISIMKALEYSNFDSEPALKFAEALTISTHYTCINQNDVAEVLQIWVALSSLKTNIPKVTMLVDLTTTAAHDVRDN